MTKQPLVVSPSANSDWLDFLDRYMSIDLCVDDYPDLTDVFTWLQNHFAIEDYVKVKMEYFGYDEITDYIKSKNWKPDDVFSEEDLEQWAEENDFKKDDWEDEDY